MGGTTQANDGTLLRLEDNVIAMAQLVNRLDGVRQLVVSERAIVTPAARDELRAKQVTLVREDAQTRSIAIRQRDWDIRLIIGTEDNNYHRGKWAAPPAVGAEYAVARGSLAQLPEIGHCIAQIEFGKPLGVCVTSNPHVVACEANRRPMIRAAVVNDIDEALDARRTLDANLFVVRTDASFNLQELLDAVA